MTILSGVCRKARNTNTSTTAVMTAQQQQSHRVHFESDHSNNNATTTTASIASIEDFVATRSNKPLALLRPIIKHPNNKSWMNTSTIGGNGGAIVDGDNNTTVMSDFLFNVECEMITTVASLVTFIRQILPDQPMEHCDELIDGHPFFPIGTKLFYRYDNGEMQCVLEGIVKSINVEQQSYDLVLVN